MAAGDPYDITVTFHLFLHDDGVDTLRHRCPGHDAHTLTGMNHTGKRPAGPGSTEHGQLRRAACRQIGARHSVTIHGRVCVRWNVYGRKNIVSEDASERAAQCNLLNAANRLHIGFDAPSRFVH